MRVNAVDRHLGFLAAGGTLSRRERQALEDYKASLKAYEQGRWLDLIRLAERVTQGLDGSRMSDAPRMRENVGWAVEKARKALRAKGAGR